MSQGQYDNGYYFYLRKIDGTTIHRSSGREYVWLVPDFRNFLEKIMTSPRAKLPRELIGSNWIFGFSRWRIQKLCLISCTLCVMSWIRRFRASFWRWCADTLSVAAIPDNCERQIYRLIERVDQSGPQLKVLNSFICGDRLLAVRLGRDLNGIMTTRSWEQWSLFTISFHPIFVKFFFVISFVGLVFKHDSRQLAKFYFIINIVDHS